MRSPPLLLLLLVVLGFGALAVPLTRLTQDRPGTPPPARAPQSVGASVNGLIRFRFAHQPVRVSLKQGDRTIAAVSIPAESPAEFTAVLALPGDGVELLVEEVLAGQLILNLRAEADPAVLEHALRESIAELAADLPGVTLSLDHLEHFKPGRPTPTHRDRVSAG